MQSPNAGDCCGTATAQCSHKNTKVRSRLWFCAYQWPWFTDHPLLTCVVCAVHQEPYMASHWVKFPSCNVHSVKWMAMLNNATRQIRSREGSHAPHKQHNHSKHAWQLCDADHNGNQSHWHCSHYITIQYNTDKPQPGHASIPMLFHIPLGAISGS